MWRLSDATVTVMPLTADAGRDGSGDVKFSTPTMAPLPVATARTARPLKLITRDAVAQAVEQFDRRIDTPPHRTPIIAGELQEWEDWAGPGLNLFRHVTVQLGLPSTHHIPASLLSPNVRAKLCDLRDALEQEAAELAKRRR